MPECNGTGLIDHLPRLQSHYDDVMYVNGDRCKNWVDMTDE